jgi:uncharacterized membrane protein YccC
MGNPVDCSLFQGGKMGCDFQEMVMSSKQRPKLDVTQLEILVREDIEKCLQEVTAAVNQAPEGALIDASEEPVREALARLRQAIYQKAIQMKVDAAEAAFSPSPARGRRATKQRPAGRQP